MKKLFVLLSLLISVTSFAEEIVVTDAIALAVEKAESQSVPFSDRLTDLSLDNVDLRFSNSDNHIMTLNYSNKKESCLVHVSVSRDLINFKGNFGPVLYLGGGCSSL